MKKSDQAWASGIVKELLPWYQAHRRVLPWRENPTPYAVLVSEFMLQQTQVTTVLPYFARFLKKFPDFHHLANAEINDVLSLWSGLGYYQRARNLHQTAQIISELYNGEFPTTYEEVIKLPGIGKYTAGAILSIAFEQNIPLLDGNVIRLLTRLKHWTTPVKTLQKQLWELSTLLVAQTKTPAELNQALMELPALLCLPKSPKCLLCPLQKKCNSRGKTENIPNKGKAKERVVLHRVVPVIYTKEALLLTQHSHKRHLSELYDFPWLEEAISLTEIFGEQSWQAGKTIRHAIMNTQYHLTPYFLFLTRKRKKNLPKEFAWQERKRLNQDIPLTGSAKKVLKLLANEGK